MNLQDLNWVKEAQAAEAKPYHPLQPLTEEQAGGIPIKKNDFSYFITIYNLVLTIVIILAAVMIVVGGVQYTASGANPSQKQDGSKRIQSALLGLGIALLSFLILNTINPAIVKNPSLFDIFSPAPPQAPVGGPIKLPQRQAEDLLATEVTIGRSEVSLDGINKDTIDEINRLQGLCSCPVVITSGTEGIHGTGPISHATGFKLDLRSKNQDGTLTNLTNYIMGGTDNTFRYVNQGSDSSRGTWMMYSNTKSGNVLTRYTLEQIGTDDEHWDVLVRNLE